MDFDEDVHLCMRCGRIVEGLANYITHRQQLCYKLEQPLNSVFLPSAPEIVGEPEAPVMPSVAHDIYKLSASDFFLSLNLQSNFKNSDSFMDEASESVKSTDCDSEILCSKLDIPALEHDLEIPFPDNKSLCCDSVLNENVCVDLNNVIFPDEKWNDFPMECHNLYNSAIPSIENGKCEQSFSSSDGNDQISDLNILTENLIGNTDTVKKTCRKRLQKKVLKKYTYTNFSALNVPRTSYRQKLNANDSMLCCQRKQTSFLCIFCNKTFSFASTYSDHILVCKNYKDESTRELEVFKNEKLLVCSSHFKCLVCSFYCNESFAFLYHLKSAGHRQNAASLKNPLICILCKDECSASDELNEHFSRCHLQYSKAEHPVIIAEKKRNLHCCYCLNLIRSANLFDDQKCIDKLQEEDIAHIKQGATNVSSCFYGIDKPMINSFMSKVDTFIKSRSSDVSKDPVSPQNLHENSEGEDSTGLQDQLVPKKRKKRLSRQSSSASIQENIPCEEPSKKRIIARITSKNGRFIYKKMTLSKRVLSCPTCSLKFFTKLALKDHTKTCVEDNQNHTLKMKITLKKRNRSNGVSAFLCDRCTYVGKNFSQLSRHFRTHSGEKPFKCPHCSYTFSLSSQLVRHKRLHTGQKPYKCPYCTYSCNTQENLRKHILKTKKHEGKMVYPCELCDFETNDFLDYKGHLLEIHSVDVPSGVTDS